MKEQRTNLRTGILLLYGITLIVLVVSVGYSLILSWQGILGNSSRDLYRQAYTTSALIKGSLVDGSKILDIARFRLEQAMKEPPLTAKQAHEILHAVVETFSIYNTSDTFGLLLYLDAGGQLLARSGEYPTLALDLSDRYYYRSLRNDPLKKFSVGRLRKAATTGKMVFHLAMPVRDSSHGFAGVVAIQIGELELASLLVETLDRGKSRILVQDPTGSSIFLYPVPEEVPYADNPFNRTLFNLQRDSTAKTEFFRIKGGESGFPETVYVAYDRDPVFGFTTWVSVPESQILMLFIHQNLHLLFYALLASLMVSMLFLGLYRQALRLEKAIKEATLDHITLISNRRGMEKECRRLWRQAARSGKPISILFIDIDHFKMFNDLWGHEIGDTVLQKVAQVIRHNSTRPLDFCSRWGGEEFVVVLPDTGLKNAGTVADHINNSLRHVRLSKGSIRIPPVTLSIGIASTECGAAPTPDILIMRADRAMIEAKESGRNRVVFESCPAGESSSPSVVSKDMVQVA